VSGIIVFDCKVLFVLIFIVLCVRFIKKNCSFLLLLQPTLLCVWFIFRISLFADYLVKRDKMFVKSLIACALVALSVVTVKARTYIIN